MSVPVAIPPAELSAALRATLRELWGPEARLDGWRSELITRHGRRRVVRYELDASLPDGGEGQQLACVGKFYERDAEGRLVAETLTGLAAAGGDRPAFVVPRLLQYFAPSRLVLMTYEEGEELTPAIVRLGRVVLEGVASGLAALHGAALPVALPLVTTPTVIIEALAPRVHAIAGRVPAVSGALERAFAGLASATPVPTPPVFLHGDFAPAQLLWRGGRIVILDFDRTTRGDPALDLGNLLAQLYRSALRKPGRLGEFAALRATLLDAYQRASASDRGLAERVRWYERATLLRKLHSLLFDTKRHPEPAALERRRAEALHLLDEVVVRDAARAC